MAANTTVLLVVCLTIYAWNTKKDFTVYGGILFVCLIALLIGSIHLYFYQVQFHYFVYSIFGVIIFGGFLIYDT